MAKQVKSKAKKSKVKTKKSPPIQFLIPTKLQYNTLCDLYPRLASRFVCAEHLLPTKPGPKATVEEKAAYRKARDETYILMQTAWLEGRQMNRIASRIKTLPTRCDECMYFSVRYHPMFRKKQSLEEIANSTPVELMPILGRCLLWEKQVNSGFKTSMVNVVCNDVPCTRGIKGKQVIGDIKPTDLPSRNNIPTIWLNGVEYGIL